MLGPQLKGRQAKRALMFCLAILLLFFGLKAVLVRHGKGRGAKHLHGSNTCTFTAPAPTLHCTWPAAAATALPLALHPWIVAGQGDPAGGPGAAARS